MMGKSVDQFLMPREVVDSLVRGVGVCGQEGGERLVQDGHGRFPGRVHFFDQLRFEPALRARAMRSAWSPIRASNLAMSRVLCSSIFYAAFGLGAPAVWATLYCFANIQ